MNNQGILVAQGEDKSYEDGNWRGTNQNEENEEEHLEEFSYEDKVLQALQCKNEGIKIKVYDYASSLKPEELIEWLNEMGKFFEWKPMVEGKKMIFFL